MDLEDVYDRLAVAGFVYGPVFQGLRSAWRREGEVFVEVSLPEEALDDAVSYGLHPALLDAAVQGCPSSARRSRRRRRAGCRSAGVACRCSPPELRP
ncbi:polyketide synthase dehydratase domain-containing protein [Streptomyces stramineus]